jgi:hypothetical protein
MATTLRSLGLPRDQSAKTDGKTCMEYSKSKVGKYKMGPVRCPETSVNNYHTTPRNIPEERRSRSELCMLILGETPRNLETAKY